jgi:hypothetical protein
MNPMYDGPYPEGVPNPYGPRVHAYPTRYHGPIYDRPEFGMPWVDQPFEVWESQHVPDPLGRWDDDSGVEQALRLASLVAGPLCAYHGYKRNDSVGWGVVWFLLGAVFWPVAVPIALAQGYGERAR